MGSIDALITTLFDTTRSRSGSWRWNGFYFNNSGSLDRDSTEFERRLVDMNIASELLYYYGDATIASMLELCLLVAVLRSIFTLGRSFLYVLGCRYVC